MNGLETGIQRWQRRQWHLAMLLGWLCASLLGIIGLIAFKPVIVAKLNSYQPTIMFDQAPAPFKDWCTDKDNQDAYVYWASNNVLLYTNNGFGLCGWVDNQPHRVSDRETVLDQREGYLKQAYRDERFSCNQTPRTEPWELVRTRDAVCVVACGQVIDCAEGRFVLRENVDATHYQDELTELIRSGVKPLRHP